VIRRHGRENNFKAILETIRSLLSGTGSVNRVIPPFLQKVILGQGSPDLASYRSDAVRAYASSTAGVAKPNSFLDYGDTFVDEQHLRASFPESTVQILPERTSTQGRETGQRKNYRLRITETEQKETLVEAEPYAFPDGIRGNPVRFTPRQVEAIRSGLSPGLTVVVGPPGTGTHAWTRYIFLI